VGIVSPAPLDTNSERFGPFAHLSLRRDVEVGLSRFDPGTHPGALPSSGPEPPRAHSRLSVTQEIGYA